MTCLLCSFKKLKGQKTMIKLYHGDFLEKAKNIPDDSVDLVLTDPPYGTVKGMRLKNQKDNVYGWDNVIEPKVLFAEINRILRKNGKAVLFGQEPFTSRMITEAIPNLPFSYRMIWEKDRFANGLGSKKAPVNYYEDVMVFSKTHPTSDFENDHPLRMYFTDVLNYIGLKKSEINRIIGQRATNVFRVDSTQFALCTEETYLDLIKVFGINEMKNFREYSVLKRIDTKYKESVASTFNIWEEEPVEDFEDIVVLSKRHSEYDKHPLREYFERVSNYINLTYKQINKILGHRRAEHSFYFDSSQFGLLTEQTYNELIEVFNIDKMDGFKPYSELKAIDDEYKKQVASTFNLWQKKKTKSNILKYAKDYPSIHPTQKPILLLEDLVKTFSNEGDLVVDLTMGSGSTGVACKNTGRKFIGIEMDDEYFKIAKERIETHEQQLELV